MAVMVNQINEEKSENFTTKPIMVTIALEEYRSLISENARLVYENQRLYESLNQMEKELKEREG